MKQFFLPITLVVLAIALFFWYTNPNYQIAQASSATITSLDQTAQAAGNLSQLEQKVTDNYNALTPSQISSLETLLPDNINTIQLITEIDSIGAKHGMIVQDMSLTSQDGSAGAAGASSIAANESAASESAPTESAGGAAISTTEATYGTLPFSFTVTASYPNFVAFLQDLERSLQLLDVNSIVVSNVTDKNDIYTYKVSVQTYWLL